MKAFLFKDGILRRRSPADLIALSLATIVIVAAVFHASSSHGQRGDAALTSLIASFVIVTLLMTQVLQETIESDRGRGLFDAFHVAGHSVVEYWLIKTTISILAAIPGFIVIILLHALLVPAIRPLLTIDTLVTIAFGLIAIALCATDMAMWRSSNILVSTSATAAADCIFIMLVATAPFPLKSATGGLLTVVVSIASCMKLRRLNRRYPNTYREPQIDDIR